MGLGGSPFRRIRAPTKSGSATGTAESNAIDGFDVANNALQPTLADRKVFLKPARFE